MPVKKRYETQMAWKEFDKIERPAYLRSPYFQALLKKNRLEQEAITIESLKQQGGYWGANNKGKGAAIANANENAQSHLAAIARAVDLLTAHKSILKKRGAAGIIARITGTPESTVRRYIKLLEENPQGQ